MLYMTGVHLRDITIMIFATLHLNVSHLSVFLFKVKVHDINRITIINQLCKIILFWLIITVTLLTVCLHTPASVS